MRVFRRVFDITGELEGMEVDAYIVVSERYVVVLDTMLCPADVAGMMSFVADELPGRCSACRPEQPASSAAPGSFIGSLRTAAWFPSQPD